MVRKLCNQYENQSGKNEILIQILGFVIRGVERMIRKYRNQKEIPIPKTENWKTKLTGTNT